VARASGLGTGAARRAAGPGHTARPDRAVVGHLDLQVVLPYRTCTVADVPAECRALLASASWTIRYAARSISAGSAARSPDSSIRTASPAAAAS
jgi:hypothetical protein